MCRLWLSASLVVASMSVAPLGLAQETRPGTIRDNRLLIDDQKRRQPLNPNPPLGLLPTPEDALMDPRMTRSWATLPPRYFIGYFLDLLI